MTVWNAFFLNKAFDFEIKFHFNSRNEQKLSTGSDNGLVLNRRQAIIWTNADPFHWRIYAVLGGEMS